MKNPNLNFLLGLALGALLSTSFTLLGVRSGVFGTQSAHRGARIPEQDSIFDHANRLAQSGLESHAKTEPTTTPISKPTSKPTSKPVARTEMLASRSPMDAETVRETLKRAEAARVSAERLITKLSRNIMAPPSLAQSSPAPQAPFRAVAAPAARSVVAKAVSPAAAVVPALPMAPRFASSVPQVLTLAEDGLFKVEWARVAGARRYRVVLENEKGERVMTRSTTGTKLFIAPPRTAQARELRVSLLAMKDHVSEGQPGEKRRLILK